MTFTNSSLTIVAGDGSEFSIAAHLSSAKLLSA